MSLEFPGRTKSWDGIGDAVVRGLSHPQSQSRSHSHSYFILLRHYTQINLGKKEVHDHTSLITNC